MAKKITRTWKIEEDIARSLDAFARQTHMFMGDAVQLGVWFVMHATPDQRQALLEAMDRREAIAFNLVRDDKASGSAERKFRDERRKPGDDKGRQAG